MADSYNTTVAFSAVDIYNGGTGTAVAVLSHSFAGDVPGYFIPMVQLEGLNGTAANITVEVWIRYSMSAYFQHYTSGAVTKTTAASTVFIWSYPDGIIPLLRASNAQVEIRVYSDNSNDTSISGNAWLLKSHVSVPYLAETTASGFPTTTVIDVNNVDEFQNTDDWYNNHYIEVFDADTNTSAIRRITDQAGLTLTLESALPFTPVSGDTVKILKAVTGDIGTVNGAQPISTSDISADIEREGGTLDTLDDLTKAGGDGDLASIKTTVDSITINDNGEVSTTIKNNEAYGPLNELNG
jgi:hypothetical protein